MTNAHPLTYSYPQTAELLGVSHSTVSRMVRAGELTTVMIGKRRRIPANDPLLVALRASQ